MNSSRALARRLCAGVAWLGMFRVFVGVAVAFASGPMLAANHSIVTPPDASLASETCTDENGSPWQEGATPSTPGLWANGKRGAVGWDLVYSDDKQKLKVILYTYDSRGRPTWLSSKMTAIASDASWKDLFYKYTSTDPAGREVGSVAIRFLPNDPTRVALCLRHTSIGPRTLGQRASEASLHAPAGDEITTTNCEQL